MKNKQYLKPCITIVHIDEADIISCSITSDGQSARSLFSNAEESDDVEFD